MKFLLPIALLVLNTFCKAQETTVRNLVFEGAGIRGIAYAGVIEEFEKAHLLSQINKIGGTSAGAIIALITSLGYNSQEIRNIIENTDFNKFNEGKFLFIGGLHRIKKNYGWYKGNRFDKWLKKVIEEKTLHGEITFLQLHNKGYKDLYITASCLNKQRMIVFSHETYPDMKVKDAVRISMSIPLYFEAIFIDSTGAIISNPEKREDLDLVVDGGIIGNFPIAIFDSVAFDAFNNKIRIPNSETLGIRIDSDLQIENDKSSKELIPLQINSLPSYMEAFYIFILENLNRNDLTEDDWKRTISVSSGDIGPRLKKLSSIQKELLVNNGRQGVIQFLQDEK